MQHLVYIFYCMIDCKDWESETEIMEWIMHVCHSSHDSQTEANEKKKNPHFGGTSFRSFSLIFPFRLDWITSAVLKHICCIEHSCTKISLVQDVSLFSTLKCYHFKNVLGSCRGHKSRLIGPWLNFVCSYVHCKRCPAPTNKLYSHEPPLALSLLLEGKVEGSRMKGSVTGSVMILWTASLARNKSTIWDRHNNDTKQTKKWWLRDWDRISAPCVLVQ